LGAGLGNKFPNDLSASRWRLRDIFVPKSSILLKDLDGDAGAIAAGQSGIADRAADGIALVRRSTKRRAVVIQHDELQLPGVPFDRKYPQFCFLRLRHKSEMRHGNHRYGLPELNRQTAVTFPKTLRRGINSRQSGLAKFQPRVSRSIVATAITFAESTMSWMPTHSSG